MAKIGLIGIGMISEFHLMGLREANAKIAAIADTDEKKSRAAAEGFKAEYYSDYRKLLENANIDSVIIALPNNLHYECCVAAIENNKHIFCEKPMTTKVEHSADLVRRANRTDRIFQIGFMKRFHPGFKRVKEVLDTIGEIEFANFHIYLSGAIRPRGAFTPSRWHDDPVQAGGGFLTHSGSHQLDLMRFFFGDFGRVSSRVRYQPDSITDRFAHAHITMKNETKVELQLGLVDVPDLGPGWTHVREGWDECVEVVGTEGMIRVENPTWQGYKPSRVTQWLKGMPGPEQFWVDGRIQWIDEMKAFVDAVDGGNQTGPSVEDGYCVDKSIERIHAASRENREIAIDSGVTA